jgi:hypothetical protein
MTIDWYALLIHIIVNTIIISPVLWLAGRALAGKDKAKFTDAIWIVVLGTVLGTLVGWAIGTYFSALLSGWVVTIILLVMWLALVKHFFDCGWLKALAISIVAVIFFVIIVFILALIGVAIAIIWF